MPAVALPTQRIVNPRFVRALAAVLAAGALSAACDDPVEPFPCMATVDGHCWVYLGPQDTYVSAVAHVESTVWIGTAGQGLLALEATTRKWRPAGFAGKSVNAIEVAPRAGTIWVALSVPSLDTISAVVYRSTNAGRTWQPMDGGLAAANDFHAGASALSVSSSSGAHLLLAVDSRVARTVDGGKTWAVVFGETPPGTASLLSVAATVISPASGTRAWAGGGNLVFSEQFAVRSDDGGATWVELTQPGSPGRGTTGEFLPDPSNRDAVLAAVVGQVLLTTDAGASWQVALDFPYPTNFGFAMNDTVIVAVADETRAGTLNPTSLGVYVTRSFGGEWDTIPTPAEAWGGSTVAIDRLGQLVIGTRRGVWLLQR